MSVLISKGGVADFSRGGTLIDLIYSIDEMQAESMIKIYTQSK